MATKLNPDQILLSQTILNNFLQTYIIKSHIINQQKTHLLLLLFYFHLLQLLLFLFFLNFFTIFRYEPHSSRHIPISKITPSYRLYILQYIDHYIFLLKYFPHISHHFTFLINIIILTIIIILLVNRSSLRL